MSGTSKYKGVTVCKQKKKTFYRARCNMNGKVYQLGQFETEHAAAKAYDMFLIRNNREPINVLKRMQ